MSSEKKQEINIPEELQQICRDFAEVAIKHNLYTFEGKFYPPFKISGWAGIVQFSWASGRHEAESNNLTIWSNLQVTTKVKI